VGTVSKRAQSGVVVECHELQMAVVMVVVVVAEGRCGRVLMTMWESAIGWTNECYRCGRARENLVD